MNKYLCYVWQPKLTEIKINIRLYYEYRSRFSTVVVVVGVFNIFRYHVKFTTTVIVIDE